jgi:hypothetical protein
MRRVATATARGKLVDVLRFFFLVAALDKDAFLLLALCLIDVSVFIGVVKNVKRSDESDCL